MVQSTSTTGTLPRTLGLWSSVALVIGITIGSGIFRSPAGIAQKVPSPTLMIALWVGGGLITLCGALSLAELAAALPETGGFYAYLREGWGRPTAFCFGWSELVLIRASALGGIAVVFGEYLLRSIGVDPVEHYVAARSLSASAIAFAACANIIGANVGAMIVGVSTLAKFSALVLLVGASFALGGGHGASVSHWTASASGPIGICATGLAVVSVLWAYDGLGDLSFAGGEVMNPQRNLPRAIILGTLALMAIYVLTNIAYLYVIPIAGIADPRTPLVAADTMMALFGQTAAVLAIALVMSRSFEALTETFVLAIWPFYALGIAAIYRLRRLRPDMPRPYKAIGYPVVPAIFIVSVAAFVVNALINEPIPTSITFALILAGVPVYHFAFAQRDRRDRRS